MHNTGTMQPSERTLRCSISVMTGRSPIPAEPSTMKVRFARPRELTTGRPSLQPSSTNLPNYVRAHNRSNRHFTVMVGLSAAHKYLCQMQYAHAHTQHRVSAVCREGSSAELITVMNGRIFGCIIRAPCNQASGHFAVAYQS